ncbi:hypothetical protein PybrP1_009468, partial [[Pythium] brassicae (nom. inval.)]
MSQATATASQKISRCQCHQSKRSLQTLNVAVTPSPTLALDALTSRTHAPIVQFSALSKTTAAPARQVLLLALLKRQALALLHRPSGRARHWFSWPERTQEATPNQDPQGEAASIRKKKLLRELPRTQDWKSVLFT